MTTVNKLLEEDHDRISSCSTHANGQSLLDLQFAINKANHEFLKKWIHWELIVSSTGVDWDTQGELGQDNTIRWGGSGHWRWIGTKAKNLFLGLRDIFSLCPDSPPVSRSTPSDSSIVSGLKSNSTRCPNLPQVSQFTPGIPIHHYWHEQIR